MSAKKSAQRLSNRPALVESLESRKLLAAVGTTVGGVDPYSMGKGEWIWDVAKARSNTNTASVQALIDYLKARGIKWIVVKAGDGNNAPSSGLYAQFNSDLITRAHTAGLKVFAYHVVYGGVTPNSGNSTTTVAGEKAAMDKIMAVKPDGYIFKVDVEWEKLSSPNSVAEGYGKYFHDRYSTKLLGYAPPAYADLHSKFPYQGFGKYADVAMPMMYWHSIALAGTPGKIISDVDASWKKLYNGFATAGKSDSVKPLVPLGQGFDEATVATSPLELTDFFSLLRADADPASPFGYNGVGWWSAQHHSPEQWTSIANNTITAPTGSISGSVFNDTDGDGIKDLTETVLANRTVYDDTNNNGSFDAYEPFAKTNSSGNYTIPYRGAGVHRVRQVQPAGTRQSSPLGNLPQLVTLTSGQKAANIVLASTEMALITGVVYEDANDSGNRDLNERVLSGWQVYVDSNRNGVLDTGEPTTTSNSKGSYLFTIAAGNYQVRMSIKPGFRISTPAAQYHGITLGAGENIHKLFGVTSNALISGFIFNDTNANGIKESGEGALVGWRVWVDKDVDGVFDSNEPSTLSDAHGKYRVNFVGGGTWRVQTLVPTGWKATLPAPPVRKITIASGGTTSNKNFGMQHV